jgi:hypothetical protein
MYPVGERVLLLSTNRLVIQPIMHRSHLGERVFCVKSLFVEVIYVVDISGSDIPCEKRPHVKDPGRARLVVYCVKNSGVKNCQ